MRYYYFYSLSPDKRGTAATPASVPTSLQQSSPAPAEATTHPVRQSWDHVDEVVQILKTAFPLLILSLETFVEQINGRFKATPEEEIYRLVCMLLQDAIQVRLSPDLHFDSSKHVHLDIRSEDELARR